MSVEVTVIPVAIEHVFTDDGSAIKGASITEASFVDGKFWKKEVKHLADSTLAGAAPFQTAFNAAIIKERDDLLVSVSELQTKIDKLTQDILYDLRITTSEAFEARLTKTAIKILYSSDDPVAEELRLAIKTKTPINLDSKLISDFIIIAELSEEEAKQLLQDAVRNETVI